MFLSGLFTGKRHVTLVEVKSTSDTSYNGMKMSDAKMIKNSKRSAQHQLQDHVELLEASMELGGCMTNANRTGITVLFFFQVCVLVSYEVQVYSPPLCSLIYSEESWVNGCECNLT
jgi:hypothetical protein